jgi:hypothetical protein
MKVNPCHPPTPTAPRQGIGAIVGHLVVDLQDISQVVALGQNEEYALACSIKV